MGTDDRRILLISSGTVGPVMAGAGIRYWNLARVLGQHQPVTLATPDVVDLDPPPGVTLVPYGDESATPDDVGRRQAELIVDHDITVSQHLPYYHLDDQTLRSRRFVIDLYTPSILEKLEYARIDPERGEPNRKDDVATLNRLLSLGDFYICASERQRDLWLGALATAGRLELDHARADPELRSLIDVVPFGLAEQRPVATGPGPRGRFSVIQPDDRVVLWNGGMWNWLDPLTAIKATGRLAASMPHLRLVFMGTRSPTGEIPEMSIVEQAQELGSDLGLTDRHVFFNDWVPYEERQNWLLEADLALSLHQPTAEARFAYRTRMLDLLWCGVPVVATEGDTLADMVREQDIGETVPARDPDAVAGAIQRALDPERQRHMRDNLRSSASAHTWERAAGPLLAYCRTSQPASTLRGADPTADYIHHLESIYNDTAAYARRLEGVIAEQQVAMESGICYRLRQAFERAVRRVRGG